MKLRMMDLIVCPKCKNTLSLNIEQSCRKEYAEHWYNIIYENFKLNTRQTDFPGTDKIRELYETEVISGTLTCKTCNASYPIQDGIPKILSPELMPQKGMGRGNPVTDKKLDFFQDDAAPVKEDNNRFDNIQKANQSNYGYEWQMFSHKYQQWDKIYKENYVEKDAEFFKGKTGIDCGCGNARFTFSCTKNGAEMIGLDLSNAIYAAYKNGEDIPTFHAIQGDIFNLPVRDDYFDFAQSLGVIHITPDPEGALESIQKAVKPSGNLFIYVYKSYKEDNLFKHLLLYPVTLLRKLTVKMSADQLYYFLYLLLPVSLVFCFIPSMILWHIPGMKRLSNMFPYSYEQYKGRKIRDFHMNLFDRFGNPLERRYTKEEMCEWMDKVNFESYQLKENNYGWVVSGHELSVTSET
ncbi:MAG: methyltransferase domain-containing protein [Desulfobacteraceae bacterium]|nr:methyltransferase domain-containing protein [Desulfobacteraceae bacterium]